MSIPSFLYQTDVIYTFSTPSRRLRTAIRFKLYVNPECSQCYLYPLKEDIPKKHVDYVYERIKKALKGVAEVELVKNQIQGAVKRFDLLQKNVVRMTRGHSDKELSDAIIDALVMTTGPVHPIAMPELIVND
jgi:hypothetical protein